MNEEEIMVLRAVIDHVGGYDSGPRGTINKLHDEMNRQSVPLNRDLIDHNQEHHVGLVAEYPWR
jgi:hypothetical protein